MACHCLEARVLLLPRNTAWALGSAPCLCELGDSSDSARQNSHDWFRQQGDALLHVSELGQGRRVTQHSWKQD